MWSLLTSPIPETLTPSTIALNDVKEIETWILRLLSVPVPVPGKTKIEVRSLLPPSRGAHMRSHSLFIEYN